MLNSRTKAIHTGRGKNISAAALEGFLKVLGLRLKGLREFRGQSLNEAVKGLKLSHSALKKIENGKRDCRILTLDKICSYYGTTTYDILDGL